MKRVVHNVPMPNKKNQTAVLDFDGFVRLMDGNKSAKFISIVYRAKETGELARHTVNLNISRRRCLQEDLQFLKDLRPQLTGIAAIACQELLESVTDSLTGFNPRYTKHGYYEKNGNGNVDVSVKQVVYLRGYSIGKFVIEPGVYKKVNHRLKTLLKNKIREELKNCRCLEYIVTPENFVFARHAGKMIVIDASGSNLSKLAGLAPVALVETVSA